MVERTDGQIDKHKSFIDMRYNTEQYDKSNSIELNQIESSWIESKKNWTEYNGEEISYTDKRKEDMIRYDMVM